MEKVYVAAEVSIPASDALEVSAGLLAGVATGFQTVFEPTDRYDEFPAYEGTRSGATLTLLGIPDDETSDIYVVKLWVGTAETLKTLHENLSNTFVSQILTDKPTNSRGILDLSDEFACFLRSKGMGECKPLA